MLQIILVIFKTLYVKNFSATWNSAEFEIFNNREEKIFKYNVDVSSVYKNQYDQFLIKFHIFLQFFIKIRLFKIMPCQKPD